MKWTASYDASYNASYNAASYVAAADALLQSSLPLFIWDRNGKALMKIILISWNLIQSIFFHF